MAQVIKVYTTKPLPAGAEIISRGDKFFYAISRGGKTVLCTVTPCKTKFRIESKKWYAQYRHSDGSMKRRPAFTDKRASLKLAEDLEARATRRKMGLPGSTDSIFEIEMSELTDKFETYLRSKNNTINHCNQTVRRIKRLFDGCEIKVWGQISPTKVLGWLADQRKNGAIGIQTSNYYLVAAKELCNWAVNEGVVAENPLRGAKPMNAEGDVRRKRRAISADEFERLLNAARNGSTIQCMCGEERAILYIVAAWTGFRRGELASLKRNQIKLDDQHPSIVIGAAYSKRRRQDTIPLHPVVVDELRRWFEANPKGDHDMVFSLASSNGYIRTTSKMMSIDLANAKLAWIREAADVTDQASRAESDFLSYQSDDVVFADFHANRHTFITNLGKAGVSPKLAQSLARHSDIRLTFNIYTHVEMSEQTDAVGCLAGPRQTNRDESPNSATIDPLVGTTGDGTKRLGIDSADAAKPKRRIKMARGKRGMASGEAKVEPPAGDEKKSITEDESEKAFAQQFAQGLHTGCHSTSSGGSDTPIIGVAENLPQTLDLSGFSGDCQSMTDKKESSPGWARTTDTRINSPAYFAVLRGKT